MSSKRIAEHDYSEAQSLIETGQAALAAGDTYRAFADLSNARILLARGPVSAAGDKFMLSFISTLAKLHLKQLKGLEDFEELLMQMGSAAERLGDLRSMAVKDLLEGVLFISRNDTARGLSLLARGLKQADALGDKDIIAQSAEFRAIYYFLQGLYKDAVEHLDNLVQAANNPGGTEFISFLPVHLSPALILGYCAALLGQFNRSIGVLDCHWRRSRLQGDRSNSCFHQALLGIVLLIMGRRREALNHLQSGHDEAVSSENTPALHVAQKGIAYYHFFKGRLDKAYDVAKSTVTAEAIGLQYYWPVGLEMLYAFKQQGFKPLPAFDFEKEMERILKGENLHLKGAAKRIRAMQQMEHGERIKTVYTELESSEEDLLRAGDPIELSKTRIEMARIKLALKEKGPAIQLALKAWEGLSGYSEALFPDDLVKLLRIQSDRRQASPKDRLERLIDLLDEFAPSTDADELLGRIAAVTSRFFGAERGGLFWFPGEGDAGRPILRAGYNLSRNDIASEEFRPQLGLITKSFRNKEPLIIRNAGTHKDTDTRRALTAFCLPIEISGRMRAVIYQDNAYLTDQRADINRDMLMLVAHRISAAMERIFRYASFIETQRTLSVPPAGEQDEGILAESPLMKTLLAFADQAASSDASVLVLGETGVGKELLARRIHERSPRRQRPFVAVDIVSLPENLIESDLFGHEKGAFTGADRQKPGRIELAHSGTLFIDEIGDIPQAAQAKLLRVLQEKAFVRLGGTSTIASDFRLVAATNRDLVQAVAQGRFRQDLYYRLNVVPLILPPLRERGGDILLLARAFLRQYARKYNRPIPSLTPEDIARLKTYPWPGNVRELKNAMERSVILGGASSAGIGLQLGVSKPGGDPFGDSPSMDELQRRYIRHVLKLAGGRLAGPGGAAEMLGMKRTTLQARMLKLGIKAA